MPRPQLPDEDAPDGTVRQALQGNAHLVEVVASRKEDPLLRKGPRNGVEDPPRKVAVVGIARTGELAVDHEDAAGPEQYGAALPHPGVLGAEGEEDFFHNVRAP